jgi:hypothetical protein
MAQVVPHQEAASEVDRLIDNQLRAWRSVPEYAADWNDMDAADREEFHLEWVGLTEVALRQLRQLVQETPLTPRQAQRFQELEDVIAAERPTVARLLVDLSSPMPRADA